MSADAKELHEASGDRIGHNRQIDPLQASHDAEFRRFIDCR